MAGAVVAGLMFSSDGLFVSFLDKELHAGKYQMIVAGIALVVTAIQNPDGVASEVAGEKGLAPKVVRLRDRVLPRRRSAAPATSPASGSGPAERVQFDKTPGATPVG